MATPARGRGKQALEVPDILRALVEEHHYQLRVFRLLEKQVALLNQRKQPDYEVMHGVMRYMTNYPDRFHHPKEDLVFRKLVERDPPSAPQVEHLLADHVQILARGAELLALIDRCRADPRTADTFALRKSAHRYIGHLRRHMDVEELRAFPRARQVLRSADWAEIDANMKPILDPVFGEEATAEFEVLRGHEDIAPHAGRRQAARSNWVEAAAAIEAVSALLAGATKASASLSRHQRESLGAKLEFMRDLRRAESFRRRVVVVREACTRNSRMSGDITRQLAHIWSEAFKAAGRPYRQAGTRTAKLLETFRKLRRPARRPSAARTAPAK